MDILFIHQNFPGQFLHLAPALAGDRANKVVALTMRNIKPGIWKNVQVLPYSTKRASGKDTHPWVSDFEAKVIRAEACFAACKELKKRGFDPDVVIAHPGWGESLFVKEVWPNTKLGIYCEFFYNPQGADVGFDAEFQPSHETDACRLAIKNTCNRLHFALADAGLSPTHWQASTFPQPYRKKITVVHDGINTTQVAPKADASIQMKTRSGQDFTLTRSDEVITFVNRNLEPYRGYHTFMRALPQILENRPKARVIIVGSDQVSYGAAPPKSRTWKEIFMAEAKAKVSDADWQRVHFVGSLPYHHYLSLLQISTVHVYLTYPFVLSWSLLEAMSVGCAIVASDTAPVKEVIKNGKTGLLVDFFDPQGFAKAVIKLCESKALREKLSKSARKFATENYDLSAVCLPKQIEWVTRLCGFKRTTHKAQSLAS